jgi:hypothetical protein
VVFGCPEPLVPLVRRCAGFDELVPLSRDMPACDEHVPLMDLPRICGTTLANIPAEVPYLSADPALVDQWRRGLAGLRGRKIGIAWQGSPKNLHDALRSIPLLQFASLARVSNVHLISLQKGPGAEQFAEVSGRFELTDLGSRLDETGAFLDTAAVMMNLDLVITSDTAIAHVAGALGRPVWVALSYAPDWRWMLHRQDSPWYPTMRLFRQSAINRWDDVFERMAVELSTLATTSGIAHPVTIEISAGELIDRLVNLEIDRERLTDADRLASIVAEHDKLTRLHDRAIPPSSEIARLTAELKAANLSRVQAEYELRTLERAKEYGSRFVELSRSLLRAGEQRVAISRQIDELLGAKASR